MYNQRGTRRGGDPPSGWDWYWAGAGCYCKRKRALMDLMICKVHIANHSDMGCLCWYTPVYFGAGECGAGQGPVSMVHSCVPASHTYFYFVSLFWLWFYLISLLFVDPLFFFSFYSVLSSFPSLLVSLFALFPFISHIEIISPWFHSSPGSRLMMMIAAGMDW